MGQAVSASGTHNVGHFGRLDQRLARHATGPGAVAADALLVYDRDPGSKLDGKSPKMNPTRFMSSPIRVTKARAT